MKVILYIASTINGMAAKADGNSDWVSPEDTESFNRTCREVGVVIMGRKTFEIFNEMPVDEWPNKENLHIVITSKESLPTKHPNVTFVKSPSKALDEASKQNLDTAVVIGGSQTFGSFMKEKLIDEAYLDIEPLAFGTGMPLFNAGEFELSLELIEMSKLNANTIHLHYKVVK